MANQRFLILSNVSIHDEQEVIVASPTRDQDRDRKGGLGKNPTLVSKLNVGHPSSDKSRNTRFGRTIGTRGLKLGLFCLYNSESK